MKTFLTFLFLLLATTSISTGNTNDTRLFMEKRLMNQYSNLVQKAQRLRSKPWIYENERTNNLNEARQLEQKAKVLKKMAEETE